MKFMFSCLLFACALSDAYAQCWDPSCTFTQVVCPSTLPPGCAGNAYSQVITIAVPATIVVGTTTLTIQQIKLNDITGLPTGITDACNPAGCIIPGNDRGCVTISGTTASAGSYPIAVNATITLLFGPFPIARDTILSLGSWVVQAKDCAGVCGGTATNDNCGFCSGGTTGILPNCSDGVACTKDVCVSTRNCTHTDTCCVQQNIGLAMGWNIVSGYIIPTNPVMTSVFQNISSSIILVKNNAGQNYIPSLNINTIGSWDYRQGYKVKTNSTTTTLTLGCTKANSSTPISLNTGWNLVSYLRTTPMNTATALASLGSNIILVKNNAGQSYIPSLGINTIGNMQPGQGYQVKMAAPGTLIYP